MRLATWAPDLTRDGPGLLLRDIQSGKDPQIAAAVGVIRAANADVLLLTAFDWDHEGRALQAFSDLLAKAGMSYPHRLALRPNSGMATGIDLDGDGRTGTGDDAQGFGLFTGQSGMVLLSRRPLGEVRDLSATLWRDVPGNTMPPAPPDAAAIQRLSTTGHWDVALPAGPTTLHLLVYAASPPVFGTGTRNLRRNHDETAFWTAYQAAGPMVVMGSANLDPVDGDGEGEAIRALIARLQDPEPRSEGGAAAPQTGSNARQKGDPALDTADWPDADGPGNLRVDYVLPDKGLKVTGSGVLWPADGPLAETVMTASRHRLVWVNLALP
ncbi:endonuclease/exonuclease/phosphatase family protein [Paracoccus suum]|uniref:Endonuclease/exonuclease/phosphatase family protein n=1 Tax=Paracoccus suum TaxID=2259340 RepID=A0A344PH48_9RHOB|nr:endonuclease/exonuclease/phosphatase family protein [Paracoccus suum]AXC48703.1 endonuclease/exonuclease/phosphatase family protein [Paracoccus suum]